ncbi:MAG: hypothetical protein [Arizlama microvirus]|nr:MAG: hypothetical protein [Arizlama microvirus]
MGYPVSYRSSMSRSGTRAGSQGPRPRPAPGYRPGPRPTPRRPVDPRRLRPSVPRSPPRHYPEKPGAANDNTPKPRQSHLPKVARTAAYASTRRLMRLAGLERFLPYHRWIQTAWEIYELAKARGLNQDEVSDWHPVGGWVPAGQICQGRPGTIRYTVTGGPFTGPATCLVNQSVAGFQTVGNPITNGIQGLRLLTQYSQSPERGDTYRWWMRPNDGPAYWLAPQFWPNVAPYPWWNPAELPIGRPAGNPRPRPMYGPRPAPNPEMLPETGIGRERATAPRVWPRVDVAVTITPGRPPGLSVRPAARPKPPGRDVKERKFNGPGGAARLGYVLAVSAFDKVTEAQDFIDAVFEALPDSIQARYGDRPQDRVQAIWNHADQLDVAQAITNVLLNQAEDFIIGGSQGLAGDRLDSVGARRGLTGTWGPVLSAM